MIRINALYISMIHAGWNTADMQPGRSVEGCEPSKDFFAIHDSQHLLAPSSNFTKLTSRTRYISSVCSCKLVNRKLLVFQRSLKNPSSHVLSSEQSFRRLKQVENFLLHMCCAHDKWTNSLALGCENYGLHILFQREYANEISTWALISPLSSFKSLKLGVSHIDSLKLDWD